MKRGDKFWVEQKVNRNGTAQEKVKVSPVKVVMVGRECEKDETDRLFFN